MKHGLALQLRAAAAPKRSEGSSLLSTSVWVYRELPFPCQGEVGFPSQGTGWLKPRSLSHS